MLGIDSLRLDHLERFGGTGVAKHLDRFLTEADIVRDTTHPGRPNLPILDRDSDRTQSERHWRAFQSGVAGSHVQANPTLG